VGADLGMHWILISSAVVLYVPITWLELQYWRHLSIATAAGIQELSPGQRKGKLLRDGIYHVVRHPRYLSAGLGVIANSLFIDYAGVYLMILLLYPVGFAMLKFEERELVDRFGEEYRQYQREVPRILPRWRRTKVGRE
jgi:protein-S-isoprenylcysteine O-methyltransferase Ste14